MQRKSIFTSVSNTIAMVSTTTLFAVLGLYFGFPNAFVHMPILALLYPLTLYHMAITGDTTDSATGTALSPVSKKSTLAVFRSSWLVAIIAVTVCLYWVAIPVHNVGGLPWFLAVPCALAISSYIALFGAVFAALVHTTKNIFPPLARGVFAGLLWCLLEYARNVVLTGFPWLPLSAAFVPWPVVTQSASIIGTYGLSGLLVMSVALYYEAFIHRKDEKIRLSTGRTAANIITALLVFGIYQLYFVDKEENAEVLHGAFIQGNIDQNQKWSKSYQDATVHRYMSLSLEALTPTPTEKETFIKPNLLIWPETSMPFYLQDEKQYLEAFTSLAYEHDAAILIGTIGYARHAKTMQEQGTQSGQQGYDVYNRAYLITAESGPQSVSANEGKPVQGIHNPAATLAFYDKEHLVPFGEYVPSWLKVSFLEDLMQGIGAFTAGGLGSAYVRPEGQIPEGHMPKGQIQAHRPKPIMWQNLALGMLICYESIFPELAQDRVTTGATVLINISNDAWFGDSSAPEQHLHLSAMRAIEQGRYLVRGTNTGISAVVDDLGRIVEQGPLFRATSIPFTAESRTGLTVYHMLAPYLPWAVLVLTALLVALYTLRKKHGPKNHKK